MIDDGLMGVCFNNFFDNDLKEMIKKIASGGYSKDNKAWLVPVN
jgi:hypothetical protein